MNSTTATTRSFQPQQFKYRNVSDANETRRSTSVEKYIDQKNQHLSNEKKEHDFSESHQPAILIITTEENDESVDERRQPPQTMFQHAQVYANRIPASVGGITLNLIALASWINVLNNMSELSDQSIILPVRLLLITITLFLTGLNLFKVIVVPLSFIRDVLDLDTCGAWGAFFMSFTLLSSELQWVDPTPFKILTLIVLFIASTFQILMLCWYIAKHLRNAHPAPNCFPATVGIGMTAIASRGLLPIWFQQYHPGMILSLACCVVLFPWVAYKMLTNNDFVMSPSTFVLAAPISLCMIAFYNTNVLPLDILTTNANQSSNHWSNHTAVTNRSNSSTSLIVMSCHVLFVLCTIGMVVTIVCAYRRRAILTSKFWRTATGSFVHHADAGVTFPTVAYATCCMLYCSDVGGAGVGGGGCVGVFSYWAWTWVVICVLVVGSTNVLFLCHLPSWIRYGLPPSFP